MIATLIVSTVLVPLLMGLALGFLDRLSGERRRLVAGLLFLAAVVAVILIEGMPVFPPVAGRQKLPFALAGLALLFLVLGFVRLRAGRLSSALLVFVASAVPAGWIGYRLLAAAPAKAGAALAILLFFAAMAFLFQRPAEGSRPGGSSPLIGLLFVLIATAIVSVTGGYIGMAQLSGALAAVTGGWLLVAYGAFLRGDDSALSPAALPLQAWLVLAGLFMVLTLLFAPSASLVALFLTALPLVVALWLERSAGFPAGLPRAFRPLLSGLLAGLPALAAILLSVSA